ncbi:unnamed protein product [Microthlaspi erraticum]|uniref:Uncharacterized protein n=1 Tax=Microthlaspi erraticum TaxID=1685480 RepID=A0A6D2JUC0_9BRAS|nr:unnamed protein product [Microthlaspi erraticum]
MQLIVDRSRAYVFRSMNQELDDCKCAISEKDMKRGSSRFFHPKRRVTVRFLAGFDSVRSPISNKNEHEKESKTEHTRIWLPRSSFPTLLGHGYAGESLESSSET